MFEFLVFSESIFCYATIIFNYYYYLFLTHTIQRHNTRSNTKKNIQKYNANQYRNHKESNYGINKKKTQEKREETEHEENKKRKKNSQLAGSNKAVTFRTMEASYLYCCHFFLFLLTLQY